MGVELPTGGGDQRARAKEEERRRRLTREEYLDKLMFSADQCFAD